MTRTGKGDGKHRTVKKLLLSIAAVGTAASIAGLGTFAAFTDTAAESHTVTAGSVLIELGAQDTTANRLHVDALNVAPGDTIQRAVDLTNAGTIDLADVKLTTTASPSSLLDTDATDGLQMTIESCSVAWTESGPPYTYTCSGTESVVLAKRAIIGADLALSGLTVTTVGETDHLRVTLELPETAGNDFQEASSTITYTFEATQRAGTDK